MTQVGIYMPDWIIARHNTDQRIARAFARLEEFDPCTTSFVASPAFTWSINIHRLGQRFFPLPDSVVRHGLRRNTSADVLYCYGEPVDALAFFRAAGDRPTVVTTGFMSDRYMAEIRGGSAGDRQAEADRLARNLERAACVHFHSEGGRLRFLSYRPEWAEKTLSIPFLLPDLACPEANRAPSSKSEKTVRILFVGAEGLRKGIRELVAALNELGRDYLRRHGVSVTIVSRDRPAPSADHEIEWHPSLSHQETLRRMRDADIFVIVPRRESYGLVFVEAMAAGCAIISDDEETRGEILGDAGIQVPPGDVFGLKGALRRLIEDSTLRKELGARALDRARHFLPGIVAPRYGDCFRRVAAGLS